MREHGSPCIDCRDYSQCAECGLYDDSLSEEELFNLNCLLEDPNYSLYLEGYEAVCRQQPDQTAWMLPVYELSLRKIGELEGVRKVNGPRQMADFLFNAMRGLAQENFWVIPLSPAGEIMGVLPVAKGGVTMVSTDLRIMCQLALSTHVDTVVICHNHPAGYCKPSPQDVEMTRRAILAFQSVGIVCHEHFVVGVDSVYLIRAGMKREDLVDIN